MSERRFPVVLTVLAIAIVAAVPGIAAASEDAHPESDLADPESQGGDSEQEIDGADEGEETGEDPGEDDGERAFEDHLDRQASVEIEIGMRLYEEGDDYRAITSLKRYRLLADEPGADRMAHLLIGDIYRRNEYPQLAIEHYQFAGQAASRMGRDDFGAHLLGIQELCTSIRAYARCYRMLGQFRTATESQHARLAEIARLQHRFVGLVLQQPVDDEPDFDDPQLARAAGELAERRRAFEELPTKSPLAAGILSALIPGAGQAYVGRWLDGVVTLAVTGLFAGATAYSHFETESIPLTVVSGLFTAGFYSGNIANATVDARRHNAELYDDFFDALHRDLWPRVYFRVDDDRIDYDYRFDWPGHVDPQRQATEPAPIPGML